MYFDPDNLVRLAIEGGCNAIASTIGALGSVCATRRAPLCVHRQAQPQRAADLSNDDDQIMFGSVRRAHELGATGVGATIYFGSPQSHHQIIEVSQAFEEAHGWGCSRCHGATCATRRSSSTPRTTTRPPT